MSGCTAMFLIWERIAFWFSGKSTMRIRMPNTIRTQPYPNRRFSWRNLRMDMMMPTNGRITGRMKRHPYGFTSSRSFPTADSRA